MEYSSAFLWLIDFTAIDHNSVIMRTNRHFSRHRERLARDRYLTGPVDLGGPGGHKLPPLKYLVLPLGLKKKGIPTYKFSGIFPS